MNKLVNTSKFDPYHFTSEYNLPMVQIKITLNTLH